MRTGPRTTEDGRVNRAPIALALLALLMSPLAAQEYDDAPPDRYLDLEREARVKAASDFIEAMSVKDPEVAEAALTVDAVSLWEGSLRLTLRNEDWREITAWSIEVVVDVGEGRGQNTVLTEDKYMPGTLEEHTPLQPGSSRVVELNLPRRHDRPQGDYPVLSVAVKAVVFDDGRFAGSDLRAMRGVFQRRYARAAAMSKMVGRVEAALGTGVLDMLLKETPHTNEVPNAATVSLADNLRQEALRNNGLWPALLLRSADRSGVFSGVDRSPEFDAVQFLETNPEALRTATEAALSLLRSELEFVRSHLPEALR